MKAQPYNELAVDGKNAQAKEVLRTLSQLRDPRNLLLSVGLGQLLEHYCTVSVNVQHSSFFPTQCWDLVNIVKEKLTKLGQCWEWSSEALKFIDIEAPAKIVRRLQDDGTYTPMVRVEVATRNKQIAGLWCHRVTHGEGDCEPPI